MEHVITIDQLNARKRIDLAISNVLTEYSRSFIQKLIEEQAVYLNNKIVDKSSLLVKVHDVISIIVTPYQRSSDLSLIDTDLGVEKIYEHEHFLIINKPAGLLVHSASLTSKNITLVDWLRAFYPDICAVGAEDRPGIVHRLDKDTSGLMIIPRTPHAYTVFGSLFRNRTIYKIYHALVQGHPLQEGCIDLSIGRHPHIRIKMAAFNREETAVYTKKGYRIRNASTHYRVIKYFSDYTLVEFNPTTGRTHQIRVHASALGYPIMGDKTYGNSSALIERQALHAAQLQFQFDNEQFSFSTDLPDDMRIHVQ